MLLKLLLQQKSFHRLSSSLARFTMSKYNVVFVLGGPGAGKGTQCEKIVEAFGYTHLSAGELLRIEERNPESKVGQEISVHMKNGTIVPVAVTCGLLKKAMDELIAKDPSKNKFLIDGFPRNKDNLDGWESAMKDLTNLQCVLFFDCDEKVCVERCLDRGKNSGRVDDNEEILKRRINTYNKSTMPIIEYYKQLGKVRTVGAERSIDEVFADVKKVFNDFNQQ